MSLRFYNTLSRTKQPFAPIEASCVRMYVCGPTVYDAAHIGNARPLIVFDLLFRLLRHIYGAEHVKYVRNITDVDDKINLRAAERGVPIGVLTEETARNFAKDVAMLGCLAPSVEPRATQHIDEMVMLIERLVAADHAYIADGHVLFSVPSMADYGRLSRRPLDEMIAGARVDVAPYKRGDMDFVLWKPSFGTDPGWASPWGYGRPGWHIECSAMSWKHLGETFDIHGGGVDLIFPHHENEIAQTRCAFGHGVMANVWMHNGFLQVEGRKMSKSIGNFVTIRDVLSDWPGVVVRLNMLKTHYRQPIDWTLAGLKESEKTIRKWSALVQSEAQASHIAAPVMDALSDDLNTPLAVHELNQLTHPAAAPILLQASANLLGMALDAQPSRKHATQNQEGVIEGAIAQRLLARASRNWQESDRIRDALLEMGVTLKDNKDGTTSWEPKP